MHPPSRDPDSRVCLRTAKKSLLSPRTLKEFQGSLPCVSLRFHFFPLIPCTGTSRYGIGTPSCFDFALLTKTSLCFALLRCDFQHTTRAFVFFDFATFSYQKLSDKHRSMSWKLSWSSSRTVSIRLSSYCLFSPISLNSSFRFLISSPCIRFLRLLLSLYPISTGSPNTTA